MSHRTAGEPIVGILGSSIDGPEFLWMYGGLCLLCALAAWVLADCMLGPRPDDDELPDLEVYEVALLGGGVQLAITTAATQLHADGLLRSDRHARTFEAAGEPGDDAHPLERALIETVRDEPGLTAGTLRARLTEREPLPTMARALTDDGLLLDEPRRASLNRLWIIPALLLLVGAWRAIAGLNNGEPILVLLLLLLAVFTAFIRLVTWRPLATNSGRALLRHHRAEREDLGRLAVSGESALTAALFGGGALWLAAPDIAQALDVPREEQSSWTGSSSSCSASGGCAAGGGGCGGCGGGCGGG